MKNTHLIRITLVSLLVTFVLACAASAGVNDRSRQTSKPKIMRGDFAVAGTFTGTLDGNVTIGGHKILITNKTTIFEAGSGPVKRRARVTNNHVYVTGTMRKGVLVANVVVLTERSSSDRAVPLTEEFAKPTAKKVTQ